MAVVITGSTADSGGTTRLGASRITGLGNVETTRLGSTSSAETTTLGTTGSVKGEADS